MRRRMLLALMLVFGVLVFPTSASATDATADLLDFEATVEEMLAVDPTLDPPPNDGKHDFVVGGFQQDELNWGVSAHSGPMGEEPFGHVSGTIPDAQGNTEAKQGRWRVTCVNVEGNLAAIGGVPTEAESNDAVEVPFVFLFRDGGPGGGTPAEPDGFDLGGINDPNQCHDPVFLAFAAAAQPIDRGNILVHDVQP
jgi:hypothetical protein